MRGDLNLPEQKQQQESILAGKGSNLRDTGTIQNSSGKCLTEGDEILSRLIDYCSELYNHESLRDDIVPNCSQPLEEKKEIDPP